MHRSKSTSKIISIKKKKRKKNCTHANIQTCTIDTLKQNHIFTYLHLQTPMHEISRTKNFEKKEVRTSATALFRGAIALGTKKTHWTFLTCGLTELTRIVTRGTYRAGSLGTVGRKEANIAQSGADRIAKRTSCALYAYCHAAECCIKTVRTLCARRHS
jgi:hypothetical protein